MQQELKRKGKLYLIGAGPGDPELLTLRGARALFESDLILYDRLVDLGTLQQARPDAIRMYVGKHHGEQEKTQAQIFELIRTHALKGEVVARLKGGDPIVFGRGAEEWGLAVEHGIDVEIIPGISSALAVPALAGIPLTYRRISQSFAVVTGHCHSETPQEWLRYVHVDTLVVLMGVKNRAFIAESLIQAGRRAEEPIAFIERGSTMAERVITGTLGDVANSKLEVKNPAIFVIGNVVTVRNSLGFVD